jgi:hypothetical protein
MGRRKTGSRSIAQIKIVIADHVEVFDLESETLCARKQSVQRARALHPAALTYIKRLEHASKANMHDLNFPEPNARNPPMILPAIERNAGSDPDNPPDTVGYEDLERGSSDESSNMDKDDFLGSPWPFIQ